MDKKKFHSLFPHLCFRMQCLDGIPDGLSNALALNTDLHIKERQFASVFGFIDGNDGTVHTPL